MHTWILPFLNYAGPYCKKKIYIYIYIKILSDWLQESDLIETFFVAWRSLGLWYFPKNPQNVSFFFILLFSLSSLSLSLSLSVPVSLFFFSLHPAVSYISLPCLNVRSEREVRTSERKKTHCFYPPRYTHITWN